MSITIVDSPLASLQVTETVEAFYGFGLNSMEWVASHVDLIGGRSFPREALAQALREYNETIGNDDLACAKASSLADPQTVAVVTGQQAGLFTGPAYTVHKAVSAIKLAAALEGWLGRKVVPIFWNATEDHDLSEVASCVFPEATWTADFPAGGIAAEAFDSVAVRELLPAFLESLPEYVRPMVSETLRVDHDGYGEYSSSVLARLFAGTGLVILEPRLLRPLASDFFRKSLVLNDRLRSNLDEWHQRVSERGVSPAFSKDDASGLFVIENDGVRRRLSRQKDGFDLNGTPLDLQAVEARGAECALSTAAWLRPALQNSVIPTAAFVGGPGEVSYHLQLKGVFDVLDIAPAPLWMRNHATVFGGRETTLWSNLNWQPDDLWKSVDDLRPSSDLPDEVERVFEDGESSLQALAGSLTAELEAYGCDSTIAGFHAKAKKEFGKIRNRVVKEHQRKEGVDNKRIDALMHVVRPGDCPQERRLNVFSLIASYGPELVPDLLGAFDPSETGHYLFFRD